MTVLRVAAVQAAYMLMDRDEHEVWLVTGVNEREEHGATIYNTVLYFSPDGRLAGRHRKLMPTGSERTVWGMDDGSTLSVVDTGRGRIGGLTCWENYMPLARFHLYAQGIEVWIAPTLAPGDGWIATMRHLARENRMFVIGVNPVLHADQVPAGFPARDRLLAPGYLERHGPWLEEGNTVIVAPDGTVLDASYQLIDSAATMRLLARSGIGAGTTVVFHGYAPRPRLVADEALRARRCAHP